MHRITRLSNGLTVATSEMPQMASVCLAVWVGVGARHEPKKLNGVSHFIEHLLFKGTQRRSAREITQTIEGVGGYLNAFTSEDNTCYYTKGRADRWPVMLDILMDMYLEPAFKVSEINKERQVIKEEVAMYLDHPQQLVQDLLNEVLWPNHPLGRPITGTRRSLDTIKRRDIANYHQQHYVGQTSLITAAGHIKHAQLLKALDRFGKKLNPGQSATFAPLTLAQKQPRLLYRRKKTTQVQLAIGFQCGSRHAEHRFALRLLNTVLGENMSSRLFQIIREDHGLAYSVSSSLNLFEDTGALAIYMGLESPQLRRVCRLITRELDRLKTTLIPRGELQRARDYLTGQLDLSLESTENRSMWLGEQLLSHQRIFSPGRIKRELAEIRPAQIREVARRVFQGQNLSMAMIGSAKKTPPVARWLNMEP